MFMTQNGARAVLLPLLAMQGFGMSAKLLGMAVLKSSLAETSHIFFVVYCLTCNIAPALTCWTIVVSALSVRTLFTVS